MGSGSGVDLFSGFNEVEVGEVLRRCVGCGRFVLIGPPRSGKTFFRENYLEGKEGKLGVGVTVDEHIPGIATTTKTRGEEDRGGSGILGKVMRYLEGLIPLIGRLREGVRVEDEELRRVLGDRAPRHVVEGARGMIGDSPHRAYYIPWKCVEEPSACTFDADASKALKLIKEAFGDNKRIKWFRAEYIPPGLVREVIELIREKGEGGAKEVLEDWVNAYFEAIEALRKVLGLGEDLLKWDELSIEFLSNFVNNLASYVIGGLVAIPLMGAASLALVSVLTYMAFKKEGEGYLREIIELRRSLEGLRRRDGEFSELGRLLVYRVAYAMGMSYEEAKEALMDIADLSIEELERRVNEVRKKIEELEKKIELFRQEVPAGIVTADVNEFAKGRIYPNIKVESGELRIRVGDGYHSIVRVGKFNELVNEVRDGLLKHGFVVIVGPKGIGKSTLAAAVIWELFMNGDIGLVARVDVLDSKNYSEFATFIENYGKEFSEHFGRLLILYDPVSTKAYEKVGVDVKAPIQTSIEKTVNNLMNVVNAVSSEATKPLTLIVLPSDIYNALSNDMRAKLESHSLDVSQGLINTELLAELIREYTRTKGNPNGCELSNDVVNKLAGELVKFDSGHALIARLVGEELARSNCDVGEVEELISKAKGKAEAFVILHINGLFKVHENPDITKALVEIFALRKPFVDKVRPGDPILTPGIVGLMGVSELSGWLAIRQHDLIEEAIKKILDCVGDEGEGCEDFGSALEPWVPKTVGLLRDVSEKVRDIHSAVEYIASNYGEKLTNTLKLFSNKCWKRAALIIGHALAGIPIVPKSEDLPSGVVGSLGDALRECGVDYYLLVGNEIPPLIRGLAYTHVLTEAFVDKYDEAVGEVRRVLNIAKGGDIYGAEVFCGLGLVSIIANAAGSNRPIEPGDADAALRIASIAIQHVVSADLIRPILRALEPLRDKAPQRYIVLLALALNMESLDSGTVRYILGELSYVLSNYGDVVKEHAPSLVHAIIAYANLLGKHHSYFNREEVGDVVGRVVDLLNELGRFKSSLGVIAWAVALDPVLIHGGVRVLMEEKLGINVVDKDSEILDELSGLRKKVKDLMRDEEFMGYVKSGFVKADEEVVKTAILEAASRLKSALAHYRFGNDELDEAARLFNEAAEESREIGNYENYLIARGLALRVEAIKGSLVGNELVKKFQQLYEETFSKEHFIPTARYLSNASGTLGEYLVSLALINDVEEIRKLLEEHLWVLNANRRFSTLTRLILNALLGPKVELSGELKGKLSVNSEELINVFGPHMHSEFLPALRVAFGMVRPEDAGRMCVSINDSTKEGTCMYAISAAMNDNAAVVQLRGWSINRFWELLIEMLGLLKGLGANADALFNEFMELVNGLDGKSLVQLIAPRDSMAQLALTLYTLVNGDGKLAKAHALIGTVGTTSSKLLTRLFLEAYRACCDLKNESFRRAIARLFFFHV